MRILFDEGDTAKVTKPVSVNIERNEAEKMKS
jgi:hypothetical protein